MFSVAALAKYTHLLTISLGMREFLGYRTQEHQLHLRLAAWDRCSLLHTSVSMLMLVQLHHIPILMIVLQL